MSHPLCWVNPVYSGLRLMSQPQSSTRSEAGQWLPQLPTNFCSAKDSTVSNDLIWYLFAHCLDLYLQLLKPGPLPSCWKGLSKAEAQLLLVPCSFAGMSVGRDTLEKGWLLPGPGNGRHVCSGRQRSRRSRLSPLSIVQNKRRCCI